MFYVLMENHSYSYEIYEIVNLYFPGEKIHEVISEDEVPEGSICIKSKAIVNSATVCGSCIIYKKTDNKHEDMHESSEVCEIEKNLKKAVKHAVKVSIFKAFKYMTSQEIPWGVLVGIRPTKIVNELKAHSASSDEIRKILKDKYLLRDDKIKLVMEVSDNNYSIMNTDKNLISVYVGIPFCPTRCVYCSFAAYPINKFTSFVDDYIKCLEYEICSLSKLIAETGLNVENIYIGGGTPTSINDNQFDILLQYLQIIKSPYLKEFTVEAGRPDTINESKLTSMKRNGVTRISINPQSMNDITLKRIGRCHTVSDIVEKFYLSREYGFNNINMDMILGLSGDDMESAKKTIEKLLELEPENITVHTMAVKRASLLKEKIRDKEVIPMWNPADADNVMGYISTLLHNSNYTPYYMYRQKMMVGNLENIGYCKKGFEGIYNIQMIEEKQSIIGIGVDSITKIVIPDENRIERFGNKKDIKEYIKTIDESTGEKMSFIAKSL